MGSSLSFIHCLFGFWEFSRIDPQSNFLLLDPEIESINLCLLTAPSHASWSIMEQEEIRNIQRKNGKIIVRAMMELEVATFEAIVGKLCEDYNVSCRASADWFRNNNAPFLI